MTSNEKPEEQQAATDQQRPLLTYCTRCGFVSEEKYRICPECGALIALYERSILAVVFFAVLFTPFTVIGFWLHIHTGIVLLAVEMGACVVIYSAGRKVPVPGMKERTETLRKLQEQGIPRERINELAKRLSLDWEPPDIAGRVEDTPFRKALKNIAVVWGIALAFLVLALLVYPGAWSSFMGRVLAAYLILSGAACFAHSYVANRYGGSKAKDAAYVFILIIFVGSSYLILRYVESL